MPKINEIDLKKIIKITVDLMIENNLQSLNSVIKSRDSTEIWSKISIAFKGKFCYNFISNIFNWWKNDTHKFKTEIEQELNKTKTMNENIKNKEEVVISFNETEWSNIMDGVNKHRKSFKVGFANLLSEKLNVFGINCLLRAKYNWFKESESKKKSAPFWRGIFRCNDKNCSFECLAFIKSGNLDHMTFPVNASICFERTDITHLHKMLPRKRWQGQERKDIGIELMAKGLQNTLFKNILSNKKNKSFKSKHLFIFKFLINQ